MAFVVEDGSGKSDANAYSTTAFADTYHADRGNSAWAGGTADKEAALIRATDYLEANFPWATGWKASQDQALGWPRASASDKDGYPFGSDEVPVVVQQATAELAAKALTAELRPDETRATKREQVGPLEVEYFGRAMATSYKQVEGMLRGLTTGLGGGVVEVIRS